MLMGQMMQQPLRIIDMLRYGAEAPRRGRDRLGPR